ncbi:MAG: hypothetical protein KJI69_03485 [Patescibacteria group bacterium]|nr:hypothetical protein [Patescibacteria group bacterium]
MTDYVWIVRDRGTVFRAFKNQHHAIFWALHLDGRLAKNPKVECLRIQTDSGFGKSYTEKQIKKQIEGVKF